MEIDDELILRFISATDYHDVATAKRYIEMAGFNVNAAVSLFFDMGVPAASASECCEVPSSPLQIPTGSSGLSASSSSTALSQEESTRFPRQTSRSRRNRTRPTSGAEDVDVDNESVPTALPSFNETLLDARDRISLRLNYGGTTLRSVVAPNANAELAAAAAPRDDGRTESEKAFAQLFDLPTGLVSLLPFQKARESAKDNKKFVLVNIQHDPEFQSHILNRDVWKNDTVQEILFPNFVFWQRTRTSSEGSQYCTLYNVMRFPYIAVVDPRTGRQVHVWAVEKFLTADDAVAELITFLEKHHEKQNGSIAAERTLPTATSINSSSSSSSSALQRGGHTASPCTSRGSVHSVNERRREIYIDDEDDDKPYGRSCSNSPSPKRPKKVVNDSANDRNEEEATGGTRDIRPFKSNFTPPNAPIVLSSGMSSPTGAPPASIGFNCNGNSPETLSDGESITDPMGTAYCSMNSLLSDLHKERQNRRGEQQQQLRQNGI